MMIAYAIVVAVIFKKQTLINTYVKMLFSAFLLFWFGFIIYAAYQIIQSHDYMSLFALIPFIIFGIVAFISYVIKGRN